ncbi:MAG: MBOAT family protein, partial [Verrucomicrobiota bacterium]|nr:MBOAT family protein [Verrucomicrobiota bacterium]
MLFNTVAYWIFFAIVLVVFYSLPFRYGKIFVLAASYYFYASWNSHLIVLILASTLVDYSLGLALEKAPPSRRKFLLVLSLILNLGLLGFFKYYNFFAESVALLFGLPEKSFLLRIILPIGISFYTFASLSYTIDVYRRKIPAVRNLIDYAFFIAFFPHLIAGPIIRARQFLGQIKNWARPSAIVVQQGITLILAGLLKKMVFADRFALVSDAYFNNIAAHPGYLAAWSGTLAFGMQIFFDFSGYTDIARGCAKLLGFEFPINFVRPHLAQNAAEFWQRWHITLSHWLRDYLFFPLVRAWRGRFAVYRGLFITMVLAGLWHGASWTFVLWGAYWGARLIAWQAFERSLKGSALDRIMASRFFAPINIATTFALLPIGTAFFRARTFADTVTILHTMFNLRGAPGE